MKQSDLGKSLDPSAHPYCWWWKGIHTARPYCYGGWQGIHTGRPYCWWWKVIHTARPYSWWWHTHWTYCWWWKEVHPEHPYSDDENEHTLHVHTAGGGKGYFLHVHAAGSGKGCTLHVHVGYTLHVQTAGDVKGYTIQVILLAVSRDTPCTGCWWCFSCSMMLKNQIVNGRMSGKVRHRHSAILQVVSGPIFLEY